MGYIARFLTKFIHYTRRATLYTEVSNQKPVHHIEKTHVHTHTQLLME